MKKANLGLTLGSLVFVMSLFGCAGTESIDSDVPVIDKLYEQVLKLDTAVFEAFNQCHEPGQLEKHAGYFVPDVEFYHDNGGVTWTREEMIANTEKNVCGNFRRELIPGSLNVFPVKGFGAIAQGSHQFCQFSRDTCDGLADFTMIWKNDNEHWQITRVLSYGHRSK